MAHSVSTSRELGHPPSGLPGVPDPAGSARGTPGIARRRCGRGRVGRGTSSGDRVTLAAARRAMSCVSEAHSARFRHSARVADDARRLQILQRRAGIEHPVDLAVGSVERVLVAGCRSGGQLCRCLVGLSPKRLEGVDRRPVGVGDRDGVCLPARYSPRAAAGGGLCQLVVVTAQRDENRGVQGRVEQ
jgi:hypothetical protein